MAIQTSVIQQCSQLFGRRSDRIQATSRLIEPSDAHWNDLLLEVHHDLYHKPEYVALEGLRTGARPEGFVLRHEGKLLFVPYLVRDCAELLPGLSDPTFDAVSPYGYPSILLNESGRADTNFAGAALERFGKELASRGVCSAFLRMNPILSEGFEQLFPPDLLHDNGETIGVDLTLDEKILWDQIRHGHQSTIKKCQKLGFTTRVTPLGEHIDEFLVVYRETMDRVKAEDAYYFDRDYLHRLARMDHVHLMLAELDGEIAAGCILFECGGIVQAHLAGTKTRFMFQSPFHMVLYATFLWAKSRGNRYVHLGGGVGGAKDNLHRFKAGFSDHRFRFHTLRLVTDPQRYQELLEMRAMALGTKVEALLATGFFPAYRANGV